MSPDAAARRDAKTGPHGPARALTAADLPDCGALSASAGWNQTDDDWRLMLAIGRGWGIEASGPGAGPLVASVVVMPYGRFAWISMVLVLPDHRGRGHATTLLRLAIDWLQAHRMTPVLDATPAGFPIYRLLGFVPTWGFRRYRRDAAPSAAAGDGPTVAASADDGSARGVRPLEARDWAALLALDTVSFGANRERLLRALAERLPRAAWVLERDGEIAGYALGRDGRDAAQIGPLSAPDAPGALALLDAALATTEGAVYVDLADRHAALLAPLAARGFTLQRPFTRMVLPDRREGGSAPGIPDRLVLMAGPELG